MIVADTNLIHAWIARAPDLRDAVARVRSRDADWIAPPLWQSEFRSVLSQQIRRQGVRLEVAMDTWDVAYQTMGERTIDVEPQGVMRLVAEVPISAYDAEFVALAPQFQLRLVTLDRRLTMHCPGIAMLPGEFAAS